MSNKGVGIIQLLVAVGLGSVVSMGVISMMHFSNQEQKKIHLRSELVAIQTRFAEVLHNDKTFLNTVASSANPNMACLRNRTACAASYVSSGYTPTLDRIAIVHPASSDGRIFYDGRSTSTAGFTEKGADSRSKWRYSLCCTCGNNSNLHV
ncbi:hypothetical protein [Pseudobdellovibrio exovorus]|uniref:Uncharacterized protein n=1 Tax=Pseudobdellovibrio exovorus JSS TaxID=1184267 RepID=M4V750_9BACT|nr:hypothetical protein [Pseudobdellovibrio exovorus]AGH94265.1 hypothetical protein A11Q_45 [Pseudobdellovibrio exovorus JSS]